MPVAPPTTAMGRWPPFWNRRKTINATRCPTCRLSAVGSNPAYTVRGFSISQPGKAASSVV